MLGIMASGSLGRGVIYRRQISENDWIRERPMKNGWVFSLMHSFDIYLIPFSDHCPL